MIFSGVYEIRNAINGMTFIGSSVDLKKREKGHFAALRRGKHHNKHLQRAWKKYGEGAFEFRVVLECEIDSLLDREQECIDAFEWDSLYNLQPTAGSSLGTKYSKAAKEKMSACRKGRVVSAESRSRMSEAQMGNKKFLGHRHSEETRSKIAAANQGRVFCDAHRENLSVSHMGHVHSDEHRAKISESLIGNQRCLGYRHNDESKAKNSAAGKGRVVSEETRLKMSVAQGERRQKEQSNK